MEPESFSLAADGWPDAVSNRISKHQPPPWRCEGGKQRERVLDINPNPPRVGRVVGWQRCINCRRRFFSDNVRAVLMCPVCKNVKDQRKPQRW